MIDRMMGALRAAVALILALLLLATLQQHDEEAAECAEREANIAHTQSVATPSQAPAPAKGAGKLM